MKESVKVRRIVPVVFALAMSVPGLVFASIPASTGEPVRIKVSYADLDLAKDDGIELLYRRLKSAASNACGPTSLLQAGSVRQVMGNRACYKDLLDRAVQKADNAALSKRHAS
ncbi:MAG: UrcA family protein [Gammaproteobacteria bacterium]|nr:UrcA family protein [Gammaproteobacteria bacterium]MDH4313369.1 UrcA family protein [Gammaproteobacteria bacterium]MDH5213718.1 UrcA family protein [Gammaproteobacteria bacterium]MDH5501114.1 UrcA family protein [Gammaproteobacteria bacterium]